MSWSLSIIRLLLPISLLTSLVSVKPAAKSVPEHTGVDFAFKSIVDEYMWLSRRNNIHFRKKVSVGFTNIKEEKVIGMCYLNSGFREIDVDKKYWKTANYAEKVSLLFHELSHCYCGREHDYDNGSAYQESYYRKLIDRASSTSKKSKNGYMEDGCPKSLMHPVVVNENCLVNHYDEYTKEMFNRCVPY